ncbi:MAG: neuromedin U, partial [Verrucomicrobiales bacterium]
GSSGSEADLAKAVQNPIGSLISVPIEATFDFGAPDGEATFINVQPVIPLRWGDLNLINRTIIPVIDAPGPLIGAPGIPNPIKGDGASGLGDINHSVFFSPAKAGDFIYGLGPSISFPTASDPLLGSEKWSLGPTAVILTQPKPWSLGVLARNIWSVGGASDRDNVNQFLIQPFVTYNMDDGWYLTSNPIMTANWNADSSSERWNIPLGGGFGKLHKFGNQPVNLRAEAYYNVHKPTGAPDWSARFTVQFLFPK